MPTLARATSKTVDPQRRTGSRLARKLRESFAFRELLVNLVRKDLKVRYKNSALGFLWSMLNPVLYLAVFYVVFNVLLPGIVPNYHVYILAGLLPWALFTNSLVQGTGAVVANAELVRKVYFPRELLPLAPIGAALFHFVLQFAVLLVFLLVTRYPLNAEGGLLVPSALLAEVILLAGLCLILSAVNVKARDTQYLVELVLLAWFWMTPIVYNSSLVRERLAERSIMGISLWSIYLANPMSRVVLAFQRGIYGQATVVGDERATSVIVEEPLSFYLGGLGYVAAAGVLLLIVGSIIFGRLERHFAEEL